MISWQPVRESGILPFSPCLYTTKSPIGKDVPSLLTKFCWIIDFRDWNGTPWYQTEIEKARHDPESYRKKFELEEIFVDDIEFTFLPITRDDDGVYLDKGKEGSKDKNKTIKELCRKIVTKYLWEGKNVLLICPDGTMYCDYIASVCSWWYGRPKEITDLDKKIHTKKQKEQMKVVQKYAMELLRCPFIQSRPEERGKGLNK
jgi:hypothetical protein